MQIDFYSAAESNCSLRIEWILNCKRVPYRKIDITTLDDPQAFGQISPYGYIPVLRVEGNIVCESMAIAELLEEMFPELPLLPDDLLQRCRVREVCEYINSSVHPLQNRSAVNYFLPGLDDPAVSKLRSQWILRCLGRLSKRLWNESHFAVGSEFSLADIFLYIICHKALQLGADLTPKFTTYMQTLRDDPSAPGRPV